MEAALAEMTMDDLKDTEDDIDFINERGNIASSYVAHILYAPHVQMKKTFSNLISRARTKRRLRRTLPLVMQPYRMKKSKLERCVFIFALYLASRSTILSQHEVG
jgi:hypothetical protein